MTIDSYLTTESLDYLIDLCQVILNIPNRPRLNEKSPIIESMYHQVIAELYMCKRPFNDNVGGSDIVMFDVIGVLDSVRGSFTQISDLHNIFTQMRAGMTEPVSE